MSNVAGSIVIFDDIARTGLDLENNKDFYNNETSSQYSLQNVYYKGKHISENFTLFSKVSLCVPYVLKCKAKQVQ